MLILIHTTPRRRPWLAVIFGALLTAGASTTYFSGVQ